MPKKLLLVIASTVFLSWCCSCVSINNETRFIEEASMEKSVLEQKYPFNADVELKIQEVPITTPLPDFLTLVYTNNSDCIEYEYYAHFQIEKKLKDSWYTFPPIEGYAEIDIAYYLSHLSKCEVKCYIKQYHEYMESGLYRLVCRVMHMNPNDRSINNDQEIISCEFSIE